MTLDPNIAARLKRNADGLFAAVVQERGSGDVLMVAWMDDEALHRTLTTGRATYWSRSREAYWVKGATSGNERTHASLSSWRLRVLKPTFTARRRPALISA